MRFKDKEAREYRIFAKIFKIIKNGIKDEGREDRNDIMNIENAERCLSV